MPQIIVLKPFKFAHLGYQVEEFEPSDEPRETTQEVVDVLKDEGFFTVCGEEDDGEPGKKPAGADLIAEVAATLPPAQPAIDAPPADEAAAAPVAPAPTPATVKKPGKKPSAAA